MKWLTRLGAWIIRFFSSTGPAGQNDRSADMDIVVPEVGESIFEATISRWHVADGDQVSKDDLLCELETDKISLELNAESSGVIKLQAKEGETVKVGATIAKLDSNGKDQADSSADQQKSTSKSSSDSSEKSADKSDSDQDRKTERDDQRESETEDKSDSKESEGDRSSKEPDRDTDRADDRKDSGSSAPSPDKPDIELPTRDDERSRRVAMSPIRRKIAAHLLYARQQTAMLTTFNEADLSRLQQLRSEHQDAFQEKHAVKLGMMSFFIRACIEALREFPEVNARIDGSDIVYQDFYDIGVAIGGEKGLVVPVLRDADQLDYAGIEKAVRAYADKVKNHKLELSDLEGGTFTVSNGGVYGSMLSTPIINPPQCAVLGMHAIKQRPVVVDDEIAIRPMMYLALSYDHRLIDGRQAVGFLLKIKEFIESPDEKLLNL